VTRRRWLILGSLLAVLILVALVANRGSRERHQQRQHDARQRALDDYEREPGPPEYLVALDRAPHDGFRAFQDVEAGDAKYRGKAFRVVGRASAYRYVEDAARAELTLRDRDDSATFHLHSVTSPARLEAMRRAGAFFNAPEAGELVVVDALFESRTVFTHAYIRWKGKGDDWATALREAKKGLDLDKLNRW